jgi:hypothetical protein
MLDVKTLNAIIARIPFVFFNRLRGTMVCLMAAIMYEGGSPFPDLKDAGYDKHQGRMSRNRVANRECAVQIENPH